ncbi:MAG: SPOR domain-containing protein [Pseudomonadota bacterium]
MTAARERSDEPTLEPAEPDDDGSDLETLRPSRGRSRNSVLDTQRRVAEAAREIDVSLKRTNWVWPAAAALILLVVAGAVFLYAYRWGVGTVSDGDLPLVQASSEPIKTKPESPGGLEVPHQDVMVLNPDESATVERLLPPPEIPQPPPIVPVPGASDSAANVAGALPPALNEPAEVPLEAAPTLPETSIPAAPEAKLPEAPTAPSGAESGSGASSDVTAATPPTPKPAMTSEPGASQLAAIPEPKSGDHLLQLGAFTERKASQAAWSRLQKKYPDLLGTMGSTVQEADVGGKTYYRLQAGPFPNRATALDLCAQLKARKQDCLVVKR